MAYIKLLETIQKYIRIIATSVIFIMMVFISVNVLFRIAGNPLLGNVEIVRLMMMTIIMFGISYAEFEKFHIAVEIFFEKFPYKIKVFLMVISYITGSILTLAISIIYFRVATATFVESVRKTDLLEIPIYFFEYIIAFGFLIWFLQIIANLIEVRKEVKDAS